MPVQDILRVTEFVPKYYLTDTQKEDFLDTEDNTFTETFQRRMKRAIARGSEEQFREALSEYNVEIAKLRLSGSMIRHLNETMLSPLPLPLVEHILTQTYARTVSLSVDRLRKYENGTDNVYGELLPRLVSQIFKETAPKSSSVFVDLGSGVANVVLQAALQVGCESWGCEMMDNACDLAELQEKEFIARCRLWGLSTGSIHLERGDFLKNANISKVMHRADVVLVNNQAFTPELNQGLMNLFLDLKEGCRIVSLKSFVPPDHRITARNVESPINLLEVETKQYFSNCVSWTNAPGSYCVAVKSSRMLKEFMAKKDKGGAADVKGRERSSRRKK